MSSLSWDIEFMANTVLGDTIFPNKFDVKLDLTANTTDHSQQSIAFERLHVFIGNVIHNSFMINLENDLIETILTDTDNVVSFFPDDPYDHLVAIILYSKLSAIVEERFFIDKLTLRSFQGGDISYSFDAHDHEYPPIILVDIIDNEDPWWRRPDMSVMDIIVEDENGNAKMEHQDLNWEHIELNWDADEEKEGKVIEVKKFKPRVVQGGQNDKDTDDKSKREE